MPHTCSLCNKTFQLKHNYDRHEAFCKFSHNSLIRQPKDYDETVERMTDKQMRRIVVDLTLKIQTLSNQNEHMRKEIQNLKTRQRISMTKWLDKTKIPHISFFQWIESIQVSQIHLEKVFTHDLLQGLKECIKDEIASYKYKEKLMPIYAFTQKNKTIYLYDQIIQKTPRRLNQKDEFVWSLITTEHLKKAVSILNRKFELQYQQWQDNHSDLLDQSEEWKEKDMMYMRKVIGMADNEIQRNAKLKQWIYTQIHLPYQEVSIDLD